MQATKNPGAIAPIMLLQKKISRAVMPFKHISPMAGTERARERNRAKIPRNGIFISN
jgi:hypothetical protein